MKIKRFLAVCLAAIMLMSAVTIPASAYSYDFTFPNTVSNSTRSSSLEVRGTASANFTPSVSSVSTLYYLSPTQYSSLNATNIVTKTNTSTSYFTFYSGYGGVGQKYCISGCPDMKMEAWNAYNTYGKWNM